MNKIRNQFSSISIARFQKNLLNWYKKNARPLPWRKTKNPYDIWVSEVMLQQTRVDTVIKYYPAFIKKFPTIRELASADTQDVLRCWQGLGYYRRALNMHKTAKMIHEKYQGTFPTDYQEMLFLPGIGPYTAGAIASIAFDQAVPAIDGNIKRVISRLFFLTEDVNQLDVVKKMKKKLNQVIPVNHPGDFNQALMEIGATICFPKKPDCQDCPVRIDCLAAQSNKQELLPVKGKKKGPHAVFMETAIVKNHDKFLLTRRSDKVILADMWGLPSIEIQEDFSDGNQICRQMEKILNLQFRDRPVFIKKLTHVFTHRIWKMNLYLVHVENGGHIPESHARWVDKKESENLPIPRAFQKCLQEFFLRSLV